MTSTAAKASLTLVCQAVSGRTLTIMAALGRIDGGRSPAGPQRSAGAAQQLDPATTMRHPAGYVQLSDRILMTIDQSEQRTINDRACAQSVQARRIP